MLALDRDSGSVLHDILLFRVDKPEDTARYNSFASPTPVIEEGRVYVHFGSYGTAALDTPPARRSGRGATCPATTGAAPARRRCSGASCLIVHFDGYDQQYAVALDKRTRPHGVEGRPRLRLRHRRRRHEEGLRDAGRDRGGRPDAAHQPGREGGAVARPDDRARAVARALRLALGRRSAALRERPRLRRLAAAGPPSSTRSAPTAAAT